MRILHISDLHFDQPVRVESWRNWAPKRVLGALNLKFRRGPHFKETGTKLSALVEFVRAEKIDLVLCTGDYTVLGTRGELEAARRSLEPLLETKVAFATVPGNHDVYVRDSVGLFEEIFGELLRTDLPEEQADGIWPLVRLFGDSVAVVALNSARPNPQLWRSSGRIPKTQLDALERILRHPSLRGRFVFVITHYAPLLADGGPDTWSHGLRNGAALIAACRPLTFGALLHGHVHRRYRVRLPEMSISSFCAGSTTQAHREGLWVFEVEGTEALAWSGGWNGSAYELAAEATPL